MQVPRGLHPLRRREGAEPFVLGDLAIDYDRRRVSVAGRAVELALTEYEILRVSSLNAARVVTRGERLRQVWKNGDPDGVQRVYNFIKKLRHKPGDDARNPKYILGERVLGCRMAGPEDM